MLRPADPAQARAFDILEEALDGLDCLVVEALPKAVAALDAAGLLARPTHSWVAVAAVPVEAEVVAGLRAGDTFTVDVDTSVDVEDVRCVTCGGKHADVADQPCPGARAS